MTTEQKEAIFECIQDLKVLRAKVLFGGQWVNALPQTGIVAGIDMSIESLNGALVIHAERE